MNKGMKIRSLADRMLEKFVPRTTASARECGYKYRCIEGNQYRAWCCYNPDGSGGCGRYSFYKSGC